MNIKQRSTLSNRFYQIGYFLVVFLFAIVAVSTLFFAIGIPILRANVVIAFLVTCFWMHKEYPDDSDVIKMIGIALAIICICALIATYVYDFSFDGNTYHKSTVGMLRYGWNPIYQSFGSAALRNKIIPEYDWPVWYDHYPKASWIIGAAFYAISGNIETGKCFNNILIISAALLIVSELLKRSRMGMPKCIVVGLIAVLNPITIAQSQSYYNDGAMQMLIFITMVALIEWTFDRKCRYGKTLIFCTINLALNIKFSGIIFMGIYCGAFFIWWVLRDYRVNKNIKTCWQYIRFYCITLLVTFGFTGSTSYVYNLLHKHNPLYTMIGEGKIEIITSMLPRAYERLPKVMQVIQSIFSRTSNIGHESVDDPMLKIPFEVTADQWALGDCFDTRIAGWGMLFSGIFIIAIIAVIFVVLHHLRSKDVIWKNEYFIIFTLIIVTTLIQSIFVPGLAWARYYAHLFVIPLLALCTLWNKCQKTIGQLVGVVIVLLLTLNNVNYIDYALQRVNISQDSRAELLYLSDISKNQQLQISLPGGEYMQGFLFNLMDSDIDYLYVDDLQDGTIAFNWRISYKLDG